MGQETGGRDCYWVVPGDIYYDNTETVLLPGPAPLSGAGGGGPGGRGGGERRQ